MRDNAFSIIQILEAVGLHYTTQWDVICIHENGKQTDWWKGSISWNYINDFSWKWRAKWDPFSFVKMHLNLSNKETHDRFKNNLWRDYESQSNYKKKSSNFGTAATLPYKFDW